MRRLRTSTSIVSRTQRPRGEAMRKRYVVLLLALTLAVALTGSALAGGPSLKSLSKRINAAVRLIQSKQVVTDVQYAPMAYQANGNYGGAVGCPPGWRLTGGGVEMLDVSQG